MLLALQSRVADSASDWLKSPRPKFPPAALKQFSEGSVKLRLVLTDDGSVRDAKVIKSSGEPTLDQAAQQGVLKWKMKPAALRPADLTTGRDEIIDFRQQAPIAAAVHPDRLAYFGSKQSIGGGKMWMFAPFPSYPIEARQYRAQGTAFIIVTIGQNGNTENIRLVRSSGSKLLDDAALRAVALWRAHKEYAGQKVGLPITFTLFRSRH
jgi:TonB family protein